MSFLVQNAYDHIAHVLGDQIRDIAPIDLVNEAGEYLYSMRSWGFTQGRAATLDLRASITLSSATWNPGTRTLTSVGAFSSYAFLAGDYIDTTGGTGIAKTRTEIESKTSSDSIVLATTIGSGAANDVAGEMILSASKLPDDFSELTGFTSTEGLVNTLNMTTPQQLLEMRSDEVAVARFNYWGAIVRATPAAGGPPVPILELWPDPGTNEPQWFTIFYKAKWKQQVDDTAEIQLPEQLHTLYFEILRAIASGYEKSEMGSVSARLAEVEVGPVYMAARRWDSRMQRDHGRLRGGHVRGRYRGIVRSLRTQVASPS